MTAQSFSFHFLIAQKPEKKTLKWNIASPLHQIQNITQPRSMFLLSRHQKKSELTASDIVTQDASKHNLQSK